jgi:hypothetical protein
VAGGVSFLTKFVSVVDALSSSLDTLLIDFVSCTGDALSDDVCDIDDTETDDDDDDDDEVHVMDVGDGDGDENE